jgi:hypothetical protein
MAFVPLQELLRKRKEELLAELSEVDVALEKAGAKQLFVAEEPPKAPKIEPPKPIFGLFGLPPGKAVKKILTENRRPHTRNEIVAMLLQRGAAAGSKNPERTIQRALDVNLAIGTLRASGDVIGLPEWFEKN